MSTIPGLVLSLLASVLLAPAALWTAEAMAQISGASATPTGSTCSGDSADGFCGFSASILTDNGTTLATRYAWNANADTGVFSTFDTTASAHHNVDFTVTAPGGYRLDIATSRVGDVNRIADVIGCEGSASISGVSGSSNVALSSGSISIPTNAALDITDHLSTDVHHAFSQTSGPATIFGVSNGVGQVHALDFTWSANVRSNSCEAAVRMGETNGTTLGCSACDYPGSPSRTQSTDGHFVTVTYTSLCGNATTDAEVSEQCDEGGANGSLGSCCATTCQFKPNGTLCDDGNVMTSGDQCVGGICQAVTTTTTTPGGSTTSTTLGGSGSIPVDGLKLIIVDKGSAGAKAVFVAKDTDVSKGTGTDTATIEVTFDFTYDNGVDPASAGEFVAMLGSPNWIVNKETVAKYVNKGAPTGGGTKVAVVKPGALVKLVGKNLGDTPIDIFNQSNSTTGAANTAYCIDNGGDQNCFCSTFESCEWKSIAGGTGAKVVCRAGTGDASCSALP
jgi:hypothetical protein